MYAPHTVTLYNQSVSQNDMLEDVISNNITVLEGVFYDAVKAANVKTSGLDNADAVTVFIPFNVKARDGVTDIEKRYVTPKEYKSAENKSELWTLSPDSACFFIKGRKIAGPESTFKEISGIFDEVHTVTKVDEKDFGSEHMQHWEVGGA